MTWFQRLLLLTIGLTFVLVIIGGVVRATDSGLGCPDWPTCHGQIIPPAEKHTLIEFSHRTAASIVGFVFLGVTYFAFKTERRGHPTAFWLAFTAGLLLVAQIILGGITVKKELPPEIVAAHLGTAMTFMGVLIVTAAVSLGKGRASQPLWFGSPSGFTKLALLAAIAAFATLVLGSYISGTAASLACDGWPLCNGEVLPSGDQHVGLHFLHRLLAGLLGVLLLGAMYLAFEERRPLAIRAAMVGICLLYITQALIGAANIWTTLADGVVVAHLTFAALLWCLTVAVAVASYYLPGADAVSEEGREASGGSEKVTGWAR